MKTDLSVSNNKCPICKNKSAQFFNGGWLCVNNDCSVEQHQRKVIDHGFYTEVRGFVVMRDPSVE